MKMRKLIQATAVVGGAVVAFSAPTFAEDVKTATLTLKGWKVAFMGSVGQSKGELTYQGKTRKFIMTGLGIGGMGISTSEATGVVYNMKSMDDFIGGYASARSGVTLGEDELLKDRTLWLTNENGVKIKLNTDKEGMELNLGADGTVVKWDD